MNRKEPSYGAKVHENNPGAVFALFLTIPMTVSAQKILEEFSKKTREHVVCFGDRQLTFCLLMMMMTQCIRVTTDKQNSVFYYPTIYLDEIVDGVRHSLYRLVEVRHCVAIFSLFMEDDEPGHLEKKR